VAEITGEALAGATAAPAAKVKAAATASAVVGEAVPAEEVLTYSSAVVPWPCLHYYTHTKLRDVYVRDGDVVLTKTGGCRRFHARFDVEAAGPVKSLGRLNPLGSVRFGQHATTKPSRVSDNTVNEWVAFELVMSTCFWTYWFVFSGVLLINKDTKKWIFSPHL
jgi:hypothetical protein